MRCTFHQSATSQTDIPFNLQKPGCKDHVSVKVTRIVVCVFRTPLTRRSSSFDASLHLSYTPPCLDPTITQGKSELRQTKRAAQSLHRNIVLTSNDESLRQTANSRPSGNVGYVIPDLTALVYVDIAESYPIWKRQNHCVSV